MVPQTYPSILNPYTNRHEMVVKQLASTSGLQRWTDYIPVKLSASTRPAGEQTTDGDGFIAINTSQNTSTGVAFKDWVPVYFDNDATDAWVVSASGYIPIGASGGAIAILKSFGTNAHVYLPGADGVAVSGLPTNNYTLSNGSTGYSAVDGTAGLVLDAMGSVGAELVTGYLSINTSGTASTLPATITSVAAGTAGIYTPAYLTINKTYQITASWDGNVGGKSINIAAGGVYSVAPSNAVAGTLTATVKATSSTDYGWVFITAAGAGETFRVTAFSCKEVTGIHATQATTANKPALRRGLYNVLKQSNTFTEANWLKTNIALTAGVADPFGGTAATTLTATAASGEIYQTAADAGKPYTSGIYIRRRTGSGTVSIRNAANTAWINLSLTSAWQFLVNDSGTTVSNWYLDLMIWTSGDAVDVYGAIVSPGTLTAAQILAEGGIPLTTSTAASNSGAGRYSWQFDGVNDQLVCASAPFQIADDFAIVVAINAYSVAGNPGVIAIDDGGLNNGVILYIPGGVPYVYVQAGGTSQQAHGPSISVGTPAVLSVRKVGTTLTIRTNGVDGTPVSTASVGSAAFTAMRIGYQIVGAGYFTGAIGEPVVIKGTVSASDLLTIERQVASTFPAAPTF